MVWVMFGMLVLFATIGIPISFSLGLASVITIIIMGEISLVPSLVQTLYTQTTSFTILAIPFFILIATLMNAGGHTDRIFRFARCLVAHFTGGIAQVSVLTSVIVAGMTGSAVAEAAGLGKVLIRSMAERGFDKSFSAALIAAASTIGPIIPPSIPFVLYGSLTGVSVGRLFLGGIVPGIGMGMILMLAVYFISRRRGYPKDASVEWKQAFAAFMSALPALGIPVIIIGGIVGGVFTPTEAAVVASAYSLLLGVASGGIGFRNIFGILYQCFIQTANVLFIIVSASMFGWLLVYFGASDQIFSLMVSAGSNQMVFVIITIVLLLVLGCLMEGIAIIVTIVPILFPISVKMGFDPIHFGVIIVLTIMIGLITPPIGMSVFTVSAISGMAPESIFRECKYFICSLVMLVILIALFPSVVLFVPNILMRG